MSYEFLFFAQSKTSVANTIQLFNPTTTQYSLPPLLSYLCQHFSNLFVAHHENLAQPQELQHGEQHEDDALDLEYLELALGRLVVKVRARSASTSLGSSSSAARSISRRERAIDRPWPLP